MGFIWTRYLPTRHQARIQTGRSSKLRSISEGDKLVVHSMDRLARNVEDMLRLVREINDRGISVNGPV